MTTHPRSDRTGLADTLIDRFESCVTRLDEIETLPKPYDFYYAIKNEGEGTGWRYECVGIGLTDIKEALAALRPTPANPDMTMLADPREDISFDDAGCDFALVQLCKVLGVDPESFSWDAATETFDGDVQAVIGNILRAKYGEDFDPRLAALRQSLEAAGDLARRLRKYNAAHLAFELSHEEAVDAILALRSPSGNGVGMREDVGPYKGPMTVDASLLHALWCYGNLDPVKGVVYGYGTHQKCLDDADRLLFDRTAALAAVEPARGVVSGDTIKHMWDQVEKARADGTFSSAVLPAPAGVLEDGT